MSCHEFIVKDGRGKCKKFHLRVLLTLSFSQDRNSVCRERFFTLNRCESFFQWFWHPKALFPIPWRQLDFFRRKGHFAHITKAFSNFLLHILNLRSCQNVPNRKFFCFLRLARQNQDMLCVHYPKSILVHIGMARGIGKKDPLWFFLIWSVRFLLKLFDKVFPWDMCFDSLYAFYATP